MISNIRQLTDQVVVWALLKALSSHTSSIWISAKLNFSAILVITGKVYRALNSEIQSIVTKSTFLFWKPFVTLDDAAMTMWFETTHSHHHRRRSYTEGRRCCLGIQFTRCAIQSLVCTMQGDLKNRTNSSFSSYYPSAINPFFHIILVHTGSVARNWLNYVLQTTFVFFFCIHSSCMATFVLYEYSRLDTFMFFHLFGSTVHHTTKVPTAAPFITFGGKAGRKSSELCFPSIFWHHSFRSNFGLSGFVSFGLARVRFKRSLCELPLAWMCCIATAGISIDWCN